MIKMCVWRLAIAAYSPRSHLQASEPTACSEHQQPWQPASAPGDEACPARQCYTDGTVAGMAWSVCMSVSGSQLVSHADMAEPVNVVFGDGWADPHVSKELCIRWRYTSWRTQLNDQKCNVKCFEFHAVLLVYPLYKRLSLAQCTLVKLLYQAWLELRYRSFMGLHLLYVAVLLNGWILVSVNELTVRSILLILFCMGNSVLYVTVTVVNTDWPSFHVYTQ